MYRIILHCFVNALHRIDVMHRTALHHKIGQNVPVSTTAYALEEDRRNRGICRQYSEANSENLEHHVRGSRNLRENTVRLQLMVRIQILKARPQPLRQCLEQSSRTSKSSNRKTSANRSRDSRQLGRCTSIRHYRSCRRRISVDRIISLRRDGSSISGTWYHARVSRCLAGTRSSVYGLPTFSRSATRS